MSTLIKFCVYTGTLFSALCLYLLPFKFMASYFSLSITGFCPHISRLVKLLTHRLNFYFTSKKKIHFLGSLYDFPCTFLPITHPYLFLSHTQHLCSLSTKLYEWASPPGAELNPGRPRLAPWRALQHVKHKEKEERESSHWFLACSLLCPAPCFSQSMLSSRDVLG